jgi:hypothetical protein
MRLRSSIAFSNTMPVLDHSHALLTALDDRTSFLYDRETVSTGDAELRFITISLS